MHSELKEKEKNHTRDITKLSTDRNIIRTKYISDVKKVEIENLIPHITRSIANESSQGTGIEVAVVFSRVSQHSTLLFTFAPSIRNEGKMFAISVKNALVDVAIKEDPYLKQPEQSKFGGNDV